MNKRDRILFINGAVGLALLVVISLFIQCPTVSQERTLNIALGLVATLIAACILGILNLRFDSLPGLPLNPAGGSPYFFWWYGSNLWHWHRGPPTVHLPMHLVKAMYRWERR